MIKALIFDFDGTILDTETPGYQAFQELYAEYGAELPLAVWQQAIGTQGGFDPYAYLEERIGRPVDRTVLRNQFEKWNQALIAQQQPLPGVASYLQAAKALGLRLGVASSSHLDWVEGHLRRLGLLPHFTCLRTADHVEQVKPDPALYLRAMECLDVGPDEAIAIEDSRNGALAAVRAGLRCVVIPNPMTSDMDFGAVNLRLDSLADLDLGALIERVGR